MCDPQTQSRWENDTYLVPKTLIPPNRPVWFMYYSSSRIYYNSLRWVNGFASAPDWDNVFWNGLLITPIAGSFCDLLLSDIRPPQLMSTNRVYFQPSIYSMLMMSLAKTIDGNQYLWTCNQIGVSQYGTGVCAQPSRVAVAWHKIRTYLSVAISGIC
jgi:hypothetical protein